MKATPARLPQGPGALVVPDPQTGRELLLTETGYRALSATLEHEVQASTIAALSMAAGALISALGALPLLPLVPTLVLGPMALLAGALWGRASFGRKLQRLGEGHIPQGAVLGGGKRELLNAGMLFGLLMLPPMNPVLGLCLFLTTVAAAIHSYGRRSQRLALEVQEAFEDPTLQEAAALLENPEDLVVLGQGRAESGACPVCGDGLGSAGAGVRCASCGTEHHPECWTYVGSRCAVYGCSGEDVLV